MNNKEIKEMNICNIFDAAEYGDINSLKKYYDGDINIVNKYTKLNLLQTVICGNADIDKGIDIITFLLEAGIDINYVDSKDKQNALFNLYSSTYFAGSKSLEGEYILEVTKKLVEAGIDINHRDKRGAISLSYLVAGKLDSSRLQPVLELLFEKGVDFLSKDNFGNSCLDYAKMFSWRKDIVRLMEDRIND